MEQAEYAKEKLEWTPIQYNDNSAILHMISKKPIGVFHLLDDESNFPKASDVSFLGKCHYNHALNELYSRPRMSSMDFGIKHFAGQVWYNVEGFLDKNRDTLRYDVMGLLISSKDKLISKMFLDLRNFHEASKTLNRPNGQFVTMKPRAPTVAARFNDALQQLLSTVSQSMLLMINSRYIIFFMSKLTSFYFFDFRSPLFCQVLEAQQRKNSDEGKFASKLRDLCAKFYEPPFQFDMPVVLEQLRYTGLVETIRIRKLGYPIR